MTEKRRTARAPMGDFPDQAHVRPVFEREAVGKALRERCPRRPHAIWQASAQVANPIDIPNASSADRLPGLVPIHYGRMLVSPFTF